MKKIMTLTAVLVLSFATVAEAKKVGGKVTRAKTPATVQQSTTQQKADADFNNTPNQTATTGAAQQAQGNRLGNFATGAAAGYLLSEVLSPTEAQAQTQATPATQAPTEQLTQQVQQVAPAIPTFKAVDPQNDPYLIEKTPGYLRYCLNGVQYMVGTNNSQLPPTLMVDKTNAPVQCVISQ